MEDDDTDCCPRCGCNDIKMIIEAREVAPATPEHDTWIATARAECNHCGNVFQTVDPPPAPERTRPLRFEIPCPECNSINTSVASSPLPKPGDRYRVRKMKCGSCGHPFKVNDPIPDLRTRQEYHG